VRVLILAVGRIKERGVRDAIDDYVARVRRYVNVEEIEVKDGPGREVAQAVLRRIPEGAHVALLEVDGRAYSSEGFARWLERAGSRGKGIVAFVIGGADGIPLELSRATSDRLSLSTMTLPHRLARLFLAEQLYRAMTILRGEPYAR
jgi:23S rRNA (pseudouridine1915-N3)-methyltransferase